MATVTTILSTFSVPLMLFISGLIESDTELGKNVGVLALVKIAEGVAPHAAVRDRRRALQDVVGAVEEITRVFGILSHLHKPRERLERGGRPLPPTAPELLHSGAFRGGQNHVILRLGHHTAARPSTERFCFRQARVHRLVGHIRPVLGGRCAVNKVVVVNLRPCCRLRDLLALEECKVQRFPIPGFGVTPSFDEGEKLSYRHWLARNSERLPQCGCEHGILVVPHEGAMAWIAA